MKKIDYLLILLNFLVAMDGLTTYYAVSNGAMEMNPVLVWAFQKFSIGATVFVTRLGYMFLSIALYPSFKGLKGKQFAGIYVTIILVALIVTNNSFLIASHLGLI